MEKEPEMEVKMEPENDDDVVPKVKLEDVEQACDVKVFNNNYNNNNKKVKISFDKSKSMFYYGDLTVRLLETEDAIDISGLGRAVSKVCTTIEYLKSKNIVNVVKIHTGFSSSVELVVSVTKGPAYVEYLKSMEEVMY
ncbi:hypothetical protein SAMD00019534_122080 [Acytostelium subglobosum LB1]|uniref:hypothetical protein n=1 Tax=Acytostelium subglobosum LB1 TaxID=1410327 RepID=UPI000644B6AC|nr:hypothetical protein SAMD00019534_122080 [Acytostelium subglobosum LB1]GAM29032.1 hypothetical protein SAMD00019534_122080 [Acytostelium subglobosum LB1]|eukprot:XP_012748038.1 hypothetical protein SAMD00019534_122080 [Acytostelium subglobosum LB1]